MHMQVNLSPERENLAADPSQHLITCVICQQTLPLVQAHSIAVVYVGLDDVGYWRYSLCDADQPLCCSQAHAVQAATAYHQAHHALLWGDADPRLAIPDHAAFLPLPDHAACHGCGAARTADQVVVHFDYRCTAGPRPCYCTHLLCEHCMPDAASCITDHLLPEYHRRKG